MLDADFIRAQFPALNDEWTLFDNAGGSVVPRQVIDRVCAYMRRFQMQLGASYELSVVAGAAVQEGHRAMAELIGAELDEVVIGPSSTLNLQLLANALRPQLAVGDEIVVTNLDHETNIGCWRRLQESGLVLKEWPFDRDSHRLDWSDLEPLLSDRTRLVCFSHCANVVGAIHDVAGLTRQIHAAGALVCVDGVAYAPHRKVDVKALDVDFYIVSLYKTFGPHLGLLYGKRQHLVAASNQNHFFIAAEDLPYKLQPGSPNYELTASLPGILDYFDLVDRHHFDTPPASRSAALKRLFELIAEHEERLATPLLELLSSKAGVRVLGPGEADRRRRVPLITFTVAGRDASEIPALLDPQGLAVRYGHFYAYRAIRALGLDERNGVVRISLAHYNTVEEVGRLVAALDRIL